ncbi:ead/Ea22-like family protein [Citrobacter freundii]|uniref:ead/Ea22-like family protein n=1 Tax=Citrobacter freundii TaxID=546 RepID=UPI001FFE114E|nr:ead/Ea22-like family protein [Citrobacter freundii]
MTALNKQAYRADGGDIGIGRLKEIADNAYSDEEKRWLAQRVLSLLDENLQLQRDKDSLEAAALAMRDDMREAREKLESAEKCIAELEARTVTVKLPADYRNSDGNINADMFNTCEVVGAFRDALAAAGIGVKGE